MFFLYSLKSIVLNKVSVRLPCPNCAHPNQLLTVYKKYFQVSWLLMIPIRRNGELSCPNCGNTVCKQKLVNDLQQSGHEARKMVELVNTHIKEAKSPRYPTVLFSCLLLIFAFFFVMGKYESKKTSIIVKNYCDNPKNNVLMIVEGDNEEFPYNVIYVSEIDKEKAVILTSKYAYKHLRDAQKTFRNIKEALLNKNFSEDLDEQIVLKTEDLLTRSIASIDCLDKPRKGNQDIKTESFMSNNSQQQG
jgi:predicted RNA-binding Zn-ribbon protein involved in translation (DUF1610 family)